MSQSIDFRNVRNTYRNLTTAQLYEQIVSRGEAKIAHMGPIVVHTGERTGRSANDKFIVKEPSAARTMSGGARSIARSSRRNLDALRCRRVEAYLRKAATSSFRTVAAGADLEYRIPY